MQNGKKKNMGRTTATIRTQVASLENYVGMLAKKNYVRRKGNETYVITPWYAQLCPKRLIFIHRREYLSNYIYDSEEMYALVYVFL
jgi:hypothetical protein